MTKPIFINSLVIFIFLFNLISCTQQEKKREINFPKTNLEAENLIPKPLEVNATKSGFALDKYTTIYTNTKDLKEVGEFLSKKIELKTALQLPVNSKENRNTQTVISINKSSNLDLKNQEAYQLQISNDSIILDSNTIAGAFRGIQTIRQLIPETSNDTLAENSIWVIPTGKILDSPQYNYRGTMLDVARHFFSVKDVKKYIDILSYYKINVLHLHLSDDQGWRIEIKSWPKLTEIGGSTEVGGGSGGFYSQEEFTEIVNYALAHHIMIIPEIDMPGHTNAASVSYPILNGNGKTPKLYTGMRVGFSTFDTKKDTVYTFIDDVVREITSLSPNPYFHIGGDESHVTKRNDYTYFINRVEKIVQKYGKQMIGWDEISNTNIDSTSIAQFWNSKENAEKAVTKKMKVILSPAKKAYLDMKYDSNSKFGLDWAGYIPVDSAYAWNPESYLQKEHILGVEAPLWSETISTIEELEYLAFPRVIGYAELGWTTQKNRDWENYKLRLANQAPFLNRMNVKYYPSPIINWKKNDSLHIK
ncbi:beta-N-acetylhexosaminidase [Flaviramulus sp. BrNp1-15]|uniref:family 20 glycosylhydrolase n=1 Tax=Flaviramulus sp. BrNp1-15 TaxID=2916754 RepID=UPI001EE8A047|nr:family 20 glycosylhydrolase [Flaviramulus sp. BrNp1-15]ULC58828.1 beta-N-acetylhexosaminidase [Flaviramulus sp. BrNp1-15]